LQQRHSAEIGPFEFVASITLDQGDRHEILNVLDLERASDRLLNEFKEGGAGFAPCKVTESNSS
jgi:hypothetical protein